MEMGLRGALILKFCQFLELIVTRTSGSIPTDFIYPLWFSS